MAFAPERSRKISLGRLGKHCTFVASGTAPTADRWHSRAKRSMKGVSRGGIPVREGAHSQSVRRGNSRLTLAGAGGLPVCAGCAALAVRQLFDSFDDTLAARGGNRNHIFAKLPLKT